MKKSIALKKAGGARALASLLGISTQAVNHWPDDVPPLRVYQIREKRPQWFAVKNREFKKLEHKE